ncbi:hypothetical protein HN51_048621 [Arachis hypogaea]|uniref:Disease resistance protein n=1 Tax=Arachis hypogaea TaxID=3818 RepID=A0A445E993_ARAHY|nr:putative disease resistance protein RGA3 [Arachis ipaensis]XP_016184193.1 putative disease resistance protein RGA3 [Arachis ipaensis]XP_029146953.1 putative disease resistance protein RGA3 [Arachis hypogaea]QHO25206.1 Putative disease resistance RPP13-like protein [Arachis hypogaea]QHO25207.1 Putative disease resistance RPP13-like protein [Arachis hypogaea]RYR72086.1 hypothetical protein Ahy_A02g006285 [Arachis hypogaea]
MAAGMLSCVESELQETLSGLSRQAGLVTTLERTLKMCASLRTLVEDAEHKQLFDIQAKLWMQRTVDICYDMVYILDELNLQEVGKVRVFSHQFSFFNPFRRHHKGIYALGLRHNKLREIISGFESLAEEARVYGIRRSAKLENWNICERQFNPLFEYEVYGREVEREFLVSNLLDGNDDIRVIFIEGMAGMGKTTLAKLVYQNYQVKAYFGYKAWVSVSEEFNLRKIVMAILGFSTSDLMNDVEMELLVLIFRRVTAGERCLFVLDDVANYTLEHWQLIREFFNNFCVAGSRILVTTRKKSVPYRLGFPSDVVAYLLPLTEEDSWAIVRDTAFGPLTHTDFRYPRMKITEKCRNVPLYLRSIGAIMRYKHSEIEFREILESQIWEVAHENQMGPFLIMLYCQLPSYLKQCLLYCSIFPKDHIIVIDQLIRLWMAQGFIHTEEQGQRIFNGLLGYSIFNEVTLHGTPGSTCRLEGGISSLSHAIAENEYRRMLLDSGDEPIEDHDLPRNCRHCTLTIATHTCLPESIPNAEKLCTLMILSEYSSVDATNLSSLLSNLRRLRALILSSCSIQELPTKVGKLFHLRYLDLSFNHDLKRLPGVICNLLNLQTLNLNGCRSLQKLPKGIGKLIKLRHLEILWTTSLTYLPKGIACLTSLRTLSRFFGNSLVGSKACNIGDLEKLNNIQGNITIDGLGAETDASDAERAGLENKKGLRGLELWFTAPGAGTNDERVLGALKAPPELEDLGIFYYRGNLFPTWMIALQKLTHLTLADCEKCSVLPRLGELSSLESLKIINMPSIKKVVDSEFLGTESTDAFPKLKTLSFQKLDNWEEWVGLGDDGVQANFMPLLYSLSIVNRRKLKAIPDYIKLKRNERSSFQTNIKKCPSLEQTHYQ